VTYTFLHPSSIWLIKRLKISKARKNRTCVICKKDVFENEDYPGEYLTLAQNSHSIVCVRCAFRLVSHPVFRPYHALTHDTINSADFETMKLMKELREVYKFDHIYKDLIREDRIQENGVLTDCDFDSIPSNHEMTDFLNNKYVAASINSYKHNMIGRIRKEN
jgi:DNA-directed RNA polymerase subunit RPC12/RpoP